MVVSPLSSARRTPAVTLGTLEKCGEARSGGGLVELEVIRGFFISIMATTMDIESAPESSSYPRDSPKCTPTADHSWATRFKNSEKNQNRTLPSLTINTAAQFFFIKCKEGSFEKTSPFLIHKCLQSCVGDVKNTKKMRSEDLMVEVVDSKQSGKIQKMSKLGYYDVTVSLHNSLNSSRGVISESDLLFSPDEEIIENLKDQNVINARRIIIKRDGKSIPTKHVILTFNSPKTPSYVTAGYLKCSVRPYIPNPLRCFQCQRFGHSKNSCRGTLTCARCALPGHTSEECNGLPKCINCTGNHPSYAKSCPRWKTEKEIQTLKVNQGISYQEARKSVEARTPTNNLSFAAAITSGITKSVEKTTKSIAVQTDMTTQTSLCETTPAHNKPTTSHTQTSVASNTDKKRAGNIPPRPQAKKNSKKKPLIAKPDNKLKKEKSSFYKTKQLIDEKSLKKNDEESDELSLSASDLSDDLMEDAPCDAISPENSSRPLSKFFR